MKKLIIILIIILSLLSGCVKRAEVVSDYVQTFEIRPTTTGNCIINDHNISLLVLRNGSELLGWNDTYLTFEFWALPPVGAKRTDFVTLFFYVEDYDTQLFKYNDDFQIIWSMNSTDEMWYVQGSKTMPFLGKYNITLEFDFNMYEISLMGNSALTINFSNKEKSWIDSYNLRFHVVDLG